MSSQNRSLIAEYMNSVESNRETGHNTNRELFFEKSKFLTVAEVASILRVSSRTIERHLANGTINGKKLGRKWIVPASALDEWINLKGG
jgi:excisionase family DNA binding protein